MTPESVTSMRLACVAVLPTREVTMHDLTCTSRTPYSAHAASPSVSMYAVVNL